MGLEAPQETISPKGEVQEGEAPFTDLQAQTNNISVIEGTHSITPIDSDIPLMPSTQPQLPSTVVPLPNPSGTTVGIPPLVPPGAHLLAPPPGNTAGIPPLVPPGAHLLAPPPGFTNNTSSSAPGLTAPFPLRTTGSLGLTTMSTGTPDVDSKVIYFLCMAKIGHTEMNPIPLCLQENDVGQWDFLLLYLRTLLHLCLQLIPSLVHLLVHNVIFQ